MFKSIQKVLAVLLLAVLASTSVFAAGLGAGPTTRSFWRSDGTTLTTVPDGLNVDISGDINVDGVFTFGGIAAGDLAMAGYDVTNVGQIELAEAAGCDATAASAGFGIICADTDNSAYYITSAGTIALGAGSLTIGGSALDDAIIRADGTGGDLQYSAVTVTDANNLTGVDSTIGVGDSNSTFSIGDSTTISASAATSTAVGVSADILGTNATGLGYNAQIGLNGAVVGASSNNTNGLGAGIGYNVTVGSNGVNVGALSVSAATSAAFGRGANAAANQIVFGSSSFSYRDLYIGQGSTAPTPDAAVTYNGTGGSGTDIAGSAVYIRSGVSTGTATPAPVVIQTTTAGASGTTPQSYKTVLTARTQAVEIPDGTYLQASDNNAGAPSAGACDDNTERGRISIDTTNNLLYICNGATRGWDYITLTD